MRRLMSLIVVSVATVGAHAAVASPALTLTCAIQETQMGQAADGGQTETVLSTYTLTQPMPLISPNWAHGSLSAVSKNFPNISFQVGASGAPIEGGQSTFAFGLSFRDSNTQIFTTSDGEAVVTLGSPASADAYSGEFKAGNNTVVVACGVVQ